MVIKKLLICLLYPLVFLLYAYDVICILTFLCFSVGMLAYWGELLDRKKSVKYANTCITWLIYFITLIVCFYGYLLYTSYPIYPREVINFILYHNLGLVFLDLYFIELRGVLRKLEEYIENSPDVSFWVLWNRLLVIDKLILIGGCGLIYNGFLLTVPLFY